MNPPEKKLSLTPETLRTLNAHESQFVAGGLKPECPDSEPPSCYLTNTVSY